MSALLIHFLTAFHLLGMPAGAVHGSGAAQGAQVAQASATSVYQSASERAQSKLLAAKQVERTLSRNKQNLRGTYNKQLSEVDRLKRSRASWRRDRQLREQKARSQKTASALQLLDRRIRSQKLSVVQAKKSLSTAIANELAHNPTSVRRSQLSKTLATLGVRRRASPRKITMPDLELDELADAEELLTQIALIEQAQAKLNKQESSLGKRANHYAYMDTLRRKRQRAGELGAFDDTGVRRSIGRIGTETGRNSGTGFEGDASGGQSPPSNDEAPGAPLAGETPGGNDFAAASVVLSDVVDAQTQNALRQAQRSTSPRTKAQAAKRAQSQVKKQLNELAAGKARIMRHLRRLRGN